MPGWDVENNCVFCFEFINRKWNKWWSDKVETEAVNDPLRKESLSEVSNARAPNIITSIVIVIMSAIITFETVEESLSEVSSERASSKYHHYHCHQHYCHQHRCHQHHFHQHPIQDNYYWSSFTWKFSRSLLFSSYISWHGELTLVEQNCRAPVDMQCSGERTSVMWREKHTTYYQTEFGHDHSETQPMPSYHHIHHVMWHSGTSVLFSVTFRITNN